MNRIITIGIAILSLMTCYSCSISKMANRGDAKHDYQVSDEKRATFDSLFFAALHHTHHERYGDAAILYKKMSKVIPSEPYPYYALSRYYFNHTSKERQAVKLSSKAYSISPNNKSYKLYHADLLARTGDYKGSIDIYERMIDAGDYSLNNFFYLFILYDALGDNDALLRTIDKVDRHTVLDSEYLEYLRMQVYSKKEDTTAQMESLTKLIEINPSNIQYKLMLAAYYEQHNRASSADSIFNSVSYHHLKDDEKHAYILSLFQRNDTVALGRLVDKCLIGNGDKEPLDEPFNQNISLAFFINDTIKNWIERHLTALYSTNQKLRPEGAGYLSHYYSIMVEDSLSTHYAQQSVLLGSTHERIMQQAVTKYMDIKEYDSVMKYTSIATSLNDSFSYAYFISSLVYQQRQLYDSSMRYSYKAIHTATNNNDSNYLSTLYGNIGDIYEQMRNHSASSAAYDTALMYDPDNATVLNNYAYYLSLRSERLSLALEMSGRSLELRKDEPTFLDTYGWIHYQMGNYLHAKKYISMAIEKSENPSAELYHHLGDVELQLDNKPQALKHWKQALSLSIDDTIIIEKLEKYNDKK